MSTEKYTNIAPRHSDVRNLTLKQLDLKNKQIKVIGKGNREVVYPFGEKCRQALKEYLRIRKANSRVREVFTHHGHSLSVYKLIEIVKLRCLIAQKGITPHWWRHTAAPARLPIWRRRRHIPPCVPEETRTCPRPCCTPESCPPPPGRMLPSARDRVEERSGWARTLTTTPGHGRPGATWTLHRRGAP